MLDVVRRSARWSQPKLRVDGDFRLRTIPGDNAAVSGVVR